LGSSGFITGLINVLRGRAPLDGQASNAFAIETTDPELRTLGDCRRQQRADQIIDPIGAAGSCNTARPPDRNALHLLRYVSLKIGLVNVGEDRRYHIDPPFSGFEVRAPEAIGNLIENARGEDPLTPTSGIGNVPASAVPGCSNSSEAGQSSATGNGFACARSPPRVKGNFNWLSESSLDRGNPPCRHNGIAATPYTPQTTPEPAEPPQRPDDPHDSAGETGFIAASGSSSYPMG
jgi:hypothetical protein